MTAAAHPTPAATEAAPVLSVEGLDVTIRTASGPWLVVRDMAFDVAAGETLCIVGESGCGKSMTALSLIGLQPEAAWVSGGRVRLDGEDLARAPRRRLEDVRGQEIAMIFQEPLTSLNPVMRIGDQIAEGLRRHKGLSRSAGAARAVEMLKSVRMPDAVMRARQYPHQLSGGMRQRAMIALALACQPRVLIADEPTTALDVTIQAEILRLIADMQRAMGTGLILITHDLGVVAEMADKVIVMYAGARVEEARVEALFDDPKHPYTRALMAAMPHRRSEGAARQDLAEIKGTVPRPEDLPAGCAFAPRCPIATPRCHAEPPPLEVKAPAHTAACWEVPRHDG